MSDKLFFPSEIGRQYNKPKYPYNDVLSYNLYYAKETNKIKYIT